MLNKILKSGAALKDNKILGIIISPTQELALQTDDVVKRFSTHISQIKTCVFVGGKLNYIALYNVKLCE